MRILIAALALFLLAADAPPPVVEGHGEDEAAARERALDAAGQRLVGLLPPELRGTAPLSPEVLLRSRAAEAMGPAEPSVTVGGSRLLVARYRVALTPEYLSEARMAARESLVRARQAVLAKVLAGILVALGVAAGYLRLEEWTRGYATRLLRLAAALVLALAALALWLIG